MKKTIKKILFLSLLVAVFASCKKDENRITAEGGTDPQLTASVAGSIPLSFINKDEEAVSFKWTNPNYQFTTGPSSQDVFYTLEIDTAGANFEGAHKKSVAISNNLDVVFTQSAFNDILLNDLTFKHSVEHHIEVRVKSALASGALALYSEVLKFTVTPYPIPPKVTPPGTAPDYADGRLFMVGSATPGGWNNPVPEPAQEFTQVPGTEGKVYELTLNVSGGNSYLFLPVNGSWDHKFGAIGANNTNNTAGDDFRAEGGDMLAPAVSGTYKIQVDFQRGKFTLTKL